MSIKKMAAKGKEKEEKPCPNCGHCPTCGRSNAVPWYPYYPLPYQPMWYRYPYGPSSLTITNNSTSGPDSYTLTTTNLRFDPTWAENGTT